MGLSDDLLGRIERLHGGGIGSGGGGSRVCLDEDRINARRGGSAGEQARSFGTSGGLHGAPGGGVAAAWELRGVRDIETDGPSEFGHVTKSDEVVYESVVSEEGASFGQHDVACASFEGFLCRVRHVRGREKLALLNVDRFAGPPASGGGVRR